MNIIEYGLAGLLVVVVLVATYGYIGFASRKRVEKKFDDPRDILAAAKFYTIYNQKNEAIKLLEKGLVNNPGHPELERKLAELTSAT